MAWNEPGPSGRDPWNPPPGDNRNGPEGPDLDAFLRRLQALLSGRGPAGAPGGQKGWLSWSVALLLLAWSGSGFYTVDEQERAVVLRFGAYIGTASQGVRWHWPWPVERVEKIRVTSVRSVSSRAVLLTADENIVAAEVTAQFHVSKPEQFAFEVDDPDKTLQQTLNSVVREVVGHSMMEDVLFGSRQSVGINIRERLQQILDRYGAGLVVTEVNLQGVEPPDSVKAAFAEAIKAREDRARMVSEGEAYTKDRLPRAQAEADRQRADAQAYQDQTIARAQGDTARFNALLEQYRKAPKVTHDRLYIDTMAEILAKANKVVVDVDHGNPNFNIPLEQLLRARGPEGADVAAPVVATPPTVTAPAVHVPAPSANAERTPERAAPSAERSPQDSFRSRERGSH